jgi:hypothetical protein
MITVPKLRVQRDVHRFLACIIESQTRNRWRNIRPYAAQPLADGTQSFLLPDPYTNSLSQAPYGSWDINQFSLTHEGRRRTQYTHLDFLDVSKLILIQLRSFRGVAKSICNPEPQTSIENHTVVLWLMAHCSMIEFKNWRWRRYVPPKYWYPSTRPGLELRPLCPPARSQSMYRLRYPGL